MPDAESVNTSIVGISFAAYTLGIVLVGIYASRSAQRSNEDYFLAGRSLGPWMAALSASASAESGWVTIGLVGTAFASGLQAYWLVPGCVLGFLFSWFFMASRLGHRARELNAVTLPDFLAFSFEERRPWLRCLSVVIIMASMMAYVAGQMAAAGKAFEGSFGLDYPFGVLLGAGIVLVYTVSGGFRAACWTDYVQSLFMLGALFFFPVYLLSTVGGYTFVAEQLGSVVDETRGIGKGDLTRLIPHMSGWGLLGFLFGSRALGINFGYPGQPHILVRYMALKDHSEARRAGIISGVWTTMVIWGAVTTGIVVRAIFESGASWAQQLGEGSQGEAGLVVASMHLLPSVLAGMVLAAILSAIFSTVDSQLIVAASAAANDLFVRVFKSDNSRLSLLINRAVVLVLGIGAILLVIDEKVSVYDYVLNYAWAMLGASFGPQLILLLLWNRASYAGCISGMFVGFAVAVAWPNFYDAGDQGIEVYNLPLAFVAALCVNVIFSLAMPGKAIAHGLSKSSS
ncbi:MAG: sodium/proline symporter [Phycisphaerales bacterium]|nr:sodium/proline symporter [Phycisphaerales bacterium]